ncbi:MAG: hypothetical protein ACXVVQ_19660, partial [Solirubrobacteraceae bacterium]
AEDVPFAVGQAVSVSAHPGEDLRDALRRVLSNKQLLLVMDNFEHVLGAATLVSELLSACPGLTVLATSRDALELLDVAVPAAQKVRDPHTLMIVSGNLGLARLFGGDLELAENAFRRQLELCVGQTFSFGADEGLAGLSAISAQRGLNDRAARLAGAARKLGHNDASDPAIVHRIEHDFLGAARARLGTDAWRRAHDEGSAMSYDQAIAYALVQ